MTNIGCSASGLKHRYQQKGNGEVRAWLEQLPIDGNQPIARQAMFWIIQRLSEIDTKTRKKLGLKASRVMQ